MPEAVAENYFKPAHRRALPLKLGLFGPSKSGKTLTALKVMRGVLGPGVRFAVIDTENRASEEYQGDSEVGDFDIVHLHGNFAADRFVRLVVDAVTFGYAGLVIDGISPLWDGPGGVQQVADANTKGNNKFSGWEVASQEHAKILRAIIDCPVHLICTMRSKTAYVVDEQNRPKKVGLKPVQRDGIEYEFRLLGEMDAENNMKISGRRHFQNRIIEKPGAELARELLHYLGTPEAQESPQAEPPVAGPTPSPEPAQDGTVTLMSPQGELASVPASTREMMLAAGWMTPPDPPVAQPTRIVPGGAGPETGPESASPASVVGGPEPTGNDSPSPPELPTTNGTAATNEIAAAKADTSQMQEIITLCRRLSELRPANDFAYWMAWAEGKLKEFSPDVDYNTMSAQDAAGLVERLNKNILALEEAR